MLASIISLVVILFLIFIIPYFLKKVCHILDINDYGYYFKTLIKILIVWIFAFLFYDTIITDKDTEILTCNKKTDSCVYKFNTYENKKFIDDKTYTLSNIASVKTRIYETKHRGRKGRIRKSQHFVIDLFTHNNTKIVYPISFNDSNELHSRYKKFVSYLKNDKIIEYEDIKHNNAKEFLLYLLLFTITITLALLLYDIYNRRKSKNVKQESLLFKNKINEFIEKGYVEISSEELADDFKKNKFNKR